MKRMRRLLTVCLVWLTAGSSLAAGVPHLQCRCPHGRDKSCCLQAHDAPAIDDAAPASCCSEANPEPAGPALDPPTCVKTPSDPADGALAESPATPPRDLPLVGWLPAAAHLSPAGELVRSIGSHAPVAVLPAERIIILQHFLI